MPVSSNPFRALYNDDLTHLHTCDSPYHRIGQDVTAATIEADVDEVARAGFDAHLLQPGHGWVPLWRSRSYPFEEHAAWHGQHYGGAGTSFDRFMLGGGDCVEVFVRRCRRRRIAPFVSLRMNDCHGKEYADFTRHDIERHNVQFPTILCISRFYREHPEYRLHPDPEDYRTAGDLFAFAEDCGMRFRVRHARGFDWSIPDVRRQKWTFIEELCRGYDIDGLELDFVRHPDLFPSALPVEQRRTIMNGFIRQCRNLLDDTARHGRRRYLCIRLPNHVGAYADMGVDPAQVVEAGVDMINLSCHYNTTQVADVRAVRAMMPETPVYVEFSFMTQHLRHRGQARAERRLLTPEQLRTAVLLAYRQGATGVSAFNFMYYRRYREWVNLRGDDMDLKVDCEPPFEVVRDLKDDSTLSRADQHYFRVLRHPLATDHPLDIRWELARPAEGWSQDATLRVQANEPFGSRTVRARLNGNVLQSTDDTREPYPNPYGPPGLGRPEELRAWTVTPAWLRDGNNDLEVWLEDGRQIDLVWVDLAARAR